MTQQQAVVFHKKKVAEYAAQIDRLEQLKQIHLHMITELDTQGVVKRVWKDVKALAQNNDMKFCTFHKTEHAIWKFNKDAKSPDGLYNKCRKAEKLLRVKANKVKDAKGECRKCSQPAVPGKHFCIKHSKKSKKS